jgi:thioredoxin reductase
MSVSPRLRRHLSDAGAEPPNGENCPTGAEFRQQALLPAAALPSITDHLRLGTRVVTVGRQGLLKSDEIATGKRGGRAFLVLSVDAEGRDHVDLARAVIDCTGTWSHPNRVGDGGIPAPGERALGSRLVQRIPNLSAEEGKWAGQRILLVGSGHSAQTAARDLAQFASRHANTRIDWAIRSPQPTFGAVDDDALPARAALASYAAGLATGTSSAISVHTGVVVESFAEEGAALRVTLRRRDDDVESLLVDRVLALTGSVGDDRIYRQLQVHECYATSGPMALAAALLESPGEDCLAQTSHGIDALRCPEPGFFILGAKSYGRNNRFLLRAGWDQADEVIRALRD